ncbi:Fructosamine-3-kinase [Balamuthia mandrillaris]
MLNEKHRRRIAQRIAEAVGGGQEDRGQEELVEVVPCSGGCDNDAFVARRAGCPTKFFLKVNEKGKEEALSKFEAEAMALRDISATNTIRVPEPLVTDTLREDGGGGAFFVMEYLAFTSTDRGTDKMFGEQLAALHLASPPSQHSSSFGYAVDNWCGADKQFNTPWSIEDWPQFYSQYRLEPQRRRIQERYKDNEIVSLIEQLQEALPTFFCGLREPIKPSLLHGDLWSGNWAAVMVDNDGTSAEKQAVIFDPAAYYGHHECELGIMSMFGGPSTEFYKAYHALIPKEEGFDDRQDLYQLYHYLNHYSIFGRGYRGTCLNILRKLLEISYRAGNCRNHRA